MEIIFGFNLIQIVFKLTFQSELETTFLLVATNLINSDPNSIDLFKFNQKVENGCNWSIMLNLINFLVEFGFFDPLIHIFNVHFNLLINFLI